MLCKHFNVSHKSLQHKIQVSIEQFNCILTTELFKIVAIIKIYLNWIKLLMCYTVAHRHKTL